MKIKIEYWDMLNKPRTAEVEAPSIGDAIDKLVDDEQHPLAQVKTVEVIG